MKKFLLILLCLSFRLDSLAQKPPHETPRLVVGVVVDQMRYDYFTRFWDKFGENGFKKLVSEGFNFKNNHFNYAPTVTGPGHVSVYTGTTPKTHGIIGNDWYDKNLKEMVYCTSDSSVSPVGTNANAGKMSPHRMVSTSFADENRLHTQFRGKTIGVSIKDRGAILPAGHTANAAYWFHGKDEGRWISSSFYMNELPRWVKKFNRSGKAASYLKVWNSLYNITEYQESGSDSNPFEGGFRGKETAEFPYDLKALAEANGGFDIVTNSAFGNDLTLDFALAALEGEALGEDEFTDVLAISFSSTDKVGHNFGVNSKEVEDTYLRLDKNIEKLLAALDGKVGKGNYMLFLTADHAAVNVPAYLQTIKIPAGYLDSNRLRSDLESFLKEEYGKGLISKISNAQVFFDHENVRQVGLEIGLLEKKVAKFLLENNKIYRTFTRTQMEDISYTEGLESLVQAGFNQKRSGDVLFLMNPGVIASISRTGTTHGSGYKYDTHVPLIFYGSGIKKGSTTKPTKINDIAPTVSALLGISFPNGATGEPLNHLINRH